MGKLKELFKQYMEVAVGSQKEKDIVEEITRISEWGLKEGHWKTALVLPSKARFKSKYFIQLYQNVSNKPFGVYCGGCGESVSLDLDKCGCGHPLGCVVLSCGGLTKVG